MKKKTYKVFTIILSILAFAALASAIRYMNLEWFFVQVIVFIILSAVALLGFQYMRRQDSSTTLVFLTLFGALAIDSLYIISQFRSARICVLIAMSILGLYLTAMNMRIFDAMPKPVVVTMPKKTKK